MRFCNFDKSMGVVKIEIDHLLSNLSNITRICQRIFLFYASIRSNDYSNTNFYEIIRKKKMNSFLSFLGRGGIICVEDLIHEIFTVGPKFKYTSNFLWPFKVGNKSVINNCFTFRRRHGYREVIS